MPNYIITKTVLLSIFLVISTATAATSTVAELDSEKNQKMDIRKEPVKQCERELLPLSKYSIAQYELSLLGAAYQVQVWFSDYNSRDNVLPEDQLWSYKSSTISMFFLSQNANKSPRVQLLLLGISENTAEFLRGNISFEKYQEKYEVLIKDANKINLSILKSNPGLDKAIQADIKQLGKCAQAVGMMAAVTKK